MAKDDVAFGSPCTVNTLVMLQDVLGAIVDSPVMTINVTVAAFKVELESTRFNLTEMTICESCFWLWVV